MKKFFSNIVTLMTVLGLQAPYMVYAAPACPAKSKEIRLDIETVQQFLDYVDLEAAHMSDMEQGAPGFFVAIPQMVISDSESGAPVKPPQDMFGYYFKGSTGLGSYVMDFELGGSEGEGSDEDFGEEPAEGEEYGAGKAKNNEFATRIFSAFDDNAKALIGQTGFPGYPCSRDGNKNITKIDVHAFNAAQTEDELKKIGMVYHPKYPAALKTAPGFPLTLVDKQIALGNLTIDDKYVPTPAEQKKLLKASAAKLLLKRLITGMRIVPGKDSGVVVDCKPTESDKDDSGYLGGTLLPIIIEAPTYSGTAVDVQAIWNTGTVKEVGGRKIVVDASGKPIKADAINFYGDDFGGDFIWWKRADGKVHNAKTHIQAYLDMGYKYEFATNHDVACEPKLKTNEFCGMIKTDQKSNLQILSDDRVLTIINKKNSGLYGSVKTEITDADYATLANAQFGCATGALTSYYNYDAKTGESIDLTYFLLANNVSASDIKSYINNENVFKKYCGRFTYNGKLYIQDISYSTPRIIKEKHKGPDGHYTVTFDDAAAKKVFARKAGECGCVTGVRASYVNDKENISYNYLAYASDSNLESESFCTSNGL